MSGHSKWATIHRQKEAKDAARGQLFSKLARVIAIAVRSGGGTNPDSNFSLKVAIEKARAANLPKENIDRAIAKAQGGEETLEEVTYEGYGPEGIAVIAEATTDNRNRTGQEVKNIFERVGGRLGGPGSVSFNFEVKGLLIIEKGSNPDEQMLNLIDLGVEDIEETEEGIEAYVAPESLSETRKLLEDKGSLIKSTEIVQKPKQLMVLTESSKAEKALSFLESLSSHEDIQKVYANIDIPDEVVARINKSS